MSKLLELVCGSGNVFRDLNHPNADIEQMKSILAARIIATLDHRRLSVRAAPNLTGVTAADFSRIRRVKLDLFTIDRLVMILNRLDRRVEVSVSVQSRRKGRDLTGVGGAMTCAPPSAGPVSGPA